MSDLTEFACPHCNHLYQLNAAQMAKYGGKTIRCKNCQQKFQAPDLESAYTTDQPAPAPEVAPEPVSVEQPAAENYAEPAAEEQPQDVAVPMATPAAAPEQFALQPVYAPAPAPAPYRAPAPAGSAFVQYLTFRKYVTPFAVQVVFWFGVAVSLFAGVTSILAGIAMIGNTSRIPAPTVITMFLGGVFYIVVAPVLLRIGCELVVVIFRIYEALQDNPPAGRKR